MEFARWGHYVGGLPKGGRRGLRPHRSGIPSFLWIKIVFFGRQGVFLENYVGALRRPAFLLIKIVFFGRQRVVLENYVGALRLGVFLLTKIVFFASQGVFCVFLEKKTCLDSWFAYFSRKKTCLDC